MEKECKRCRAILPLTSFHKSSRSEDGHANVCKLCRSEQEHDRYVRDRDKILNKVWKYRYKNRSKINKKARDKYKNNLKYRKYALEYQVEYREKNREEINRKIRKYRKTPEGIFKQRQKDHNRRIVEKESVGYHTFEEWESMKKKFNYTCQICGKSEPEIELTEDHIIPLARGGTNFISNIQPLCKSCNSKKRDTLLT